MQSSQKKKLALISLLGFCACELLDWAGISHRGFRGFPPDWTMALLQAGVNIGWTAFLTVLSYFLMIRPLRQSPDQHGSDPTHGGPKGEGEPNTRSNR